MHQSSIIIISHHCTTTAGYEEKLTSNKRHVQELLTTPRFKKKHTV